MSKKPLINQVSEGIQYALGMETKSQGEFIPKLQKLPTVKVPPTKEQKRAAYLKRRKQASFNKRFSNLEKGQKTTSKLNNQLRKGVNQVNQKSREHASMKRTIAANSKSIALLKKELATQKRYAAMLLKRWEKKNQAQLSKMSASFSKQLRDSQARAYKAYARSEMAKKKRLSSGNTQKKAVAAKSRTLKPRSFSKGRRATSFRGRKSFTAKRRLSSKRPLVKRTPVRKQVRRIASRKPSFRRSPIHKPVRRIVRKAPQSRIYRRPVSSLKSRRPTVRRSPVRKPVRRIIRSSAKSSNYRRPVSRIVKRPQSRAVIKRQLQAHTERVSAIAKAKGKRRKRSIFRRIFRRR